MGSRGEARGNTDKSESGKSLQRSHGTRIIIMRCGVVLCGFGIRCAVLWYVMKTY